MSELAGERAGSFRTRSLTFFASFAFALASAFAFFHAAKAGVACFSATKAMKACCSFSVTFFAKRWFRRNLGSTPSVER